MLNLGQRSVTELARVGNLGELNLIARCFLDNAYATDGGTAWEKHGS